MRLKINYILSYLILSLSHWNFSTTTCFCHSCYLNVALQALQFTPCNMHCFVLLCFVMALLSVLSNSFDKSTHIITVMSHWALWRLKSQTSWLFAQPFVQTHIKENIKASSHCFLWRGSLGDGFPSKRTSNAENVSIWWHHHIIQDRTACAGPVVILLLSQLHRQLIPKYVSNVGCWQSAYFMAYIAAWRSAEEHYVG